MWILLFCPIGSEMLRTMERPFLAELVGLALDAKGDGWLRLMVLCENREYAEALTEALSKVPEAHRQQADHWLAAIRELHPDLQQLNRGRLASFGATPAVSPGVCAGRGRGFLALCRSLPALLARFFLPRHGL